MQRRTTAKSNLEVAYMGHRGLNLPEVFDINQPQAGALQANPGVNVNALRPYAGFASISMVEVWRSRNTNSLRVQWSKRFTQGFSYNFSYTFSKSTDNASNYSNIVPDTYNTSNLWGPSEPRQPACCCHQLRLQSAVAAGRIETVRKTLWRSGG